MIALVLIPLKAQILIVNLGNRSIIEAKDGVTIRFLGATTDCVVLTDSSIAIILCAKKVSLDTFVVYWALGFSL